MTMTLGDLMLKNDDDKPEPAPTKAEIAKTLDRAIAAFELSANAVDSVALMIADCRELLDDDGDDGDDDDTVVDDTVVDENEPAPGLVDGAEASPS